GLVPVEIDSSLPTEVRRDILGAASLSYFASRVVFCEGEDRSIDKTIYSAWFKGRDTVVLAVGSCESVRHSVKALNENRLIENLEAIGLIDRDFSPDTVLSRLGAGLVVLPVHEVEGLVCLPEIVERLAKHLGKVIPAQDVAAVIRSAITNDMVHRCALERMKSHFLNITQDIVLSKPPAWDAGSLRGHAGKLKSDLGSPQSPEAILDEELETMSSIRDSGTAKEMVQTFPSKQLATAVGAALGMKTEQLFELISSALLVDKDEVLGKLGRDLEAILSDAGLPPRTVTERPFTAAPS
ncbi:MAG TPA: hypothetical protein VGR16_03755, partial [Thermomicrobiales bacterium]|nr:hypothetical protein [Thermomicrobiales bacterium]